MGRLVRVRQQDIVPWFPEPFLALGRFVQSEVIAWLAQQVLLENVIRDSVRKCHVDRCMHACNLHAFTSVVLSASWLSTHKPGEDACIGFAM